MSMFREPVRDWAFLVTASGPRSYETNAYVPGDAVLAAGTVVAKAGADRVFHPFTGAGAEEVGGILGEAVHPDQVAAGAKLRRTILSADAEVTGQGGRMTYPEGADAAEAAALKAEAIAGLEALGIRVRG